MVLPDPLRTKWTGRIKQQHEKKKKKKKKSEHEKSMILANIDFLRSKSHWSLKPCDGRWSEQVLKRENVA